MEGAREGAGYKRRNLREGSMRILVRDGNDLIKSEVFHTKRITIGSGKSCHIHLPDSRVQANQAALVANADGTWSIENAAANHSTLLNGHAVIDRAGIKHADEITVLQFTIAIYRAAGEHFEEKPPTTSVVTEEASRLRAHPLPPAAVIKHASDPVTLHGGRCRELPDIAARLGDCTDFAKLVDLALDTLLERFGGRLAFVGVRRNSYGRFEFVQGRNKEGKTTGEPPGFENYAYRCLEAGQFICLPDAHQAGVGSVLVVPLKCGRGELGLLYVDRKKDAEPFAEADLDRLTLHASLIAGQLERLVLDQIRIHESVRDGQLTFVREIQTRMDPATVPQWPGLQLAVYCKPGLDRGGDVYDVMRLPNGLAAVLVANVSGEPTRCALAMAECRAAFRVAGLHADPAHIFLRSFNWMLSEDRAPCATQAVMIVMNPKTGATEYSTAGHIGFSLVDSRGECRTLADEAAPAAGSVRGFAYGPKTTRVGVGETLALYTAGCFSICDAGGEPLGEERFVESIGDGFGQAAAVALDELVQDQSGFFKDGRQPDDITILLFRRIDVPA